MTERLREASPQELIEATEGMLVRSVKGNLTLPDGTSVSLEEWGSIIGQLHENRLNVVAIPLSKVLTNGENICMVRTVHGLNPSEEEVSLLEGETQLLYANKLIKNQIGKGKEADLGKLHTGLLYILKKSGLSGPRFDEYVETANTWNKLTNGGEHPEKLNGDFGVRHYHAELRMVAYVKNETTAYPPTDRRFATIRVPHESGVTILGFNCVNNTPQFEGIIFSRV